MKTWAVACESGVTIEADDVEVAEDGRLIFYIDGFPPIEFPDGVWLDYQEINSQEGDD